MAAPDFIYTTGPDDQWRITEAGTYRITFDLEHYTINAVRTGDIGGGGGDEPGDKKPLESGTLYMIGDETEQVSVQLGRNPQKRLHESLSAARRHILMPVPAS